MNKYKSLWDHNWFYIRPMIWWKYECMSFYEICSEVRTLQLECCDTASDMKVSRHEHAIPLVCLGFKILDLQR